MRDGKMLAILLLALIGAVLVSATTMGGMMGGVMMGPGMMWGYGSQAGTWPLGGWGAWMAMGLGSLMMLAFWGALVIGVILLVRWIAGGTTNAEAREDPLLILQRRYAAGEVDDETYLRMRRELKGAPADGNARDPLHRAA